MQSCLEKIGTAKREDIIVRSHYGVNDQYSATHPDAISDGDIQGKGTGGGSHGFSLPKCDFTSVDNLGTVNKIDYSNFDTENGGGQYDIEGRDGIGGRKRALASSLYTKENPYWYQGGIQIDMEMERPINW